MAIYALLVGVSNYKNQDIMPLTGATKDVDYLEAWLKQEFAEKDVNILSLVNERATKSAIVNSFRDFLALANKNDQALFYFSGHGALEKMPAPLEKFEAGQYMKTLVCYDSLAGTSTLADKELRLLIRELSSTCQNIVCITDSCHSGYATRNGDQVMKSVSEIIPAREWPDFIFPADVTDRIEKAASLGEVLPEGSHIQIAACESLQSAWQVWGTSVFTANLLEVLENTHGSITYNNLFNRVRYLMANRFNQVPVLSVTGGNMHEHAGRLFLGGTTPKQNKINANVVFNRSAYSWILGRGALHGLREITGEFDVPVFTDIGSDVLTMAKIKIIFPDHSMLETKDPIDPNAQYYAAVKGIYHRSLNVLPQGESEGLRILEEFYTANKEIYHGEGIYFSKNLDVAVCNYIVLAKNGSYSLVRPNDYLPDNKPIPLIRNINGYAENSAQELFNSLISVVRWEFVKSLFNEHTSITKFPVRLQLIFKDLNGKLSLGQAEPSDRISISYSKDDLGVHLPVRLKIINTSNNDYYCAVIALYPNFKICTNWVEGEVNFISRNDTALLKQGEPVDFFQTPSATCHNLAKDTCYFLVIVSTERFEISDLQQEGLPDPLIPGTRGEIRQRMPRTAPTLALKDWATKLIRVEFENPDYVKPG
jgi:hypothetical protein